GNVEVGVAVAVDVHGEYAEALAVVFLRVLDAQTRSLADVAKSPVAVVAVQPVRQRGEVAGRADVAALAVETEADGVVAGERPVDVVADVQVGGGVAGEVRPGGGGAARVRVPAAQRARTVAGARS